VAQTRVQVGIVRGSRPARRPIWSKTRTVRGVDPASRPARPPKTPATRAPVQTERLEWSAREISSGRSNHPTRAATAAAATRQETIQIPPANLEEARPTTCRVICRAAWASRKSPASSAGARIRARRRELRAAGVGSTSGAAPDHNWSRWRSTRRRDPQVRPRTVRPRAAVGRTEPASAFQTSGRNSRPKSSTADVSTVTATPQTATHRPRLRRTEPTARPPASRRVALVAETARPLQAPPRGIAAREPRTSMAAPRSRVPQPLGVVPETISGTKPTIISTRAPVTASSR